MPLPAVAVTGRAASASRSGSGSLSRSGSGCLQSSSSVAALAIRSSPRSSLDASSSSSTRVAAFSSRSQQQQHESAASAPRVVAAKAVADAPAAPSSKESSAAATTLPSSVPIPNKDDPARAPRVLIAGGGIGGLVLAVGLLKKGMDVLVLERDLTAIRGEGKYRGPIQVQSNALAALEALDSAVAEEVLAEGVMTGDRVNGLCDGASGDWYVKFDMFHLAADAGLPVTRVISRFTLQRILADACERIGGPGVLVNGSHVVGFEEEEAGDSPSSLLRGGVWATLDDGSRVEGDLLIGADGIWSKVRSALFGRTDSATYAGYTCYTGIADFTPPDIDTVGYRVFLGHKQYFVSSDVGDGKMQWYGFHEEPAGGEDAAGGKKERLLSIFGGWTDQVTDLLRATREDDVLRRDIYDRPPIFKWASGRVALLGDSAHAMQPNLGQGGCMAIEDGYALACDLADAVAEARKKEAELLREKSNDGATSSSPSPSTPFSSLSPFSSPSSSSPPSIDIAKVLRGYERQRIPRAAAIHGLARLAAVMASTYKSYLGEGLGPLEALTRLRIPHPGRVGGYLAINAAMPPMLGWVLGGNGAALQARGGPARSCRVADVPKGFKESQFPAFLADDDALLASADCSWFLSPAGPEAEARLAAATDAVDAATEGTEAALEASLRIALPDFSTELGAPLGGGSIESASASASAAASGLFVVGSSPEAHVRLPPSFPAVACVIRRWGEPESDVVPSFLSYSSSEGASAAAAKRTPTPRGGFELVAVGSDVWVDKRKASAACAPGSDAAAPSSAAAIAAVAPSSSIRRMIPGDSVEIGARSAAADSEASTSSSLSDSSAPSSASFLVKAAHRSVVDAVAAASTSDPRRRGIRFAADVEADRTGAMAKGEGEREAVAA